MTIRIANTEIIGSVDTWRLNTNLMADVISNNAVTVERFGRGGTANGNASISGSVSATNLRTTDISGGDNTAKAPLNVTSNTAFTGNEVSFTSNAVFGSDSTFNLTGSDRLTISDVSRVRFTGASNGEFLKIGPSDTPTFTRDADLNRLSAKTIVANNITSNNDVVVQGDLVVHGTTTISSGQTFQVSDSNVGTLSVLNQSTLNGNVAIGNARSDDINIRGDVTSNIIPRANTQNLGSSDDQWGVAHVRDVVLSGNLSSRGRQVIQNGQINANAIPNDSIASSKLSNEVTMNPNVTPNTNFQTITVDSQGLVDSIKNNTIPTASDSSLGIALFSSDHFNIRSGGISIRDNFLRSFFDDDGQTVSVQSYGMNLLGGRGVSTSRLNEFSMQINADEATDTTLGVASFSNTDFDVASGVVSLGNTTVKSITAGTGLSSTRTGQTVTLSATDATASEKGVASFANDDFRFVRGHISLDPDIPRNVVGGRGCEVLANNIEHRVDVDVATEHHQGIASFNGDDFSVTSGAVSLDAGVARSITGNNGISVTGTDNAYTISAENANTSSKGVASFADDSFNVDDGVVSPSFYIPNRGIQIPGGRTNQRPSQGQFSPGFSRWNSEETRLETATDPLGGWRENLLSAGTNVSSNIRGTVTTDTWYQWIGPMLFMGGKIIDSANALNTNAVQTINYPIPFRSNILSINVTPINSTAINTGIIIVGNPGLNRFSFDINGSQNITGFTWMAVGQ